VRSSPISIFSRESLPHWLLLSAPRSALELSPDTAQTLEVLSHAGALFFDEIVKRAGLLPSRVEQALGELTTLGSVTADSFEGLRALLIPQEKRTPFAEGAQRRRHKAVTSVEFAGRWSLLQKPAGGNGANETQERDRALEVYARTLLRRYGVVFRRMLDRESLNVSWFELSRLYRRLEARGEIRGGYFVSGVSGEQFALPEAIGLLRSTRRKAGEGELIALSGTDPLNLVGILTPGRRITAIAANRILLRDGLPIAALEAGQVIALERESGEPDHLIERALCIGSMPTPLRPYYA
jgi:ATP-dependent Lhr-like helicase